MGRLAAFAMSVFVAATATLFGGAAPAAAAPGPVKAPDVCSTEQWRNPGSWGECVGKLPEVGADRVQCLKEPTPSAPDSGMAGWFASRPDPTQASGMTGRYSEYGYAGYNYTTYDIGCIPTVMHPDYKFESTVANGELMLATSIVGASNALRERAWDPQTMWGWADPLVEQATTAVYTKVFTVFGAITLAIVGLYLLWRSQQSDMSAAMTTAGWAIVVMVGVTAVASWPTWSANAADTTLVAGLNVVHGAVGPPSEEIDPCPLPDPEACADNRPPAVRASDTAVEGMLYRQWLRGVLGSAESATAEKYGPVLYDAKSFNWGEVQEIRGDAAQRDKILTAKRTNWMKVAEQIKTEDPEAYEYLTGTRGMERIGAGFIAILAALFFALFDLTASVLVLLGFLVFRWAVIAAPILGTVGLLRPASSGIRRLVNAVVAAVFNIIIFGTASAIYLFAVSLIIKTDALAGWLQVTLILLTGVVGWMLLRPYRRITQLGGKSESRAIKSISGWQRLFARQSQEGEKSGAAEPVPAGQGRVTVDTQVRPEARSEDTTIAQPATAKRTEDKQVADQTSAPKPVRAPREPVWTDGDDAETAPGFAIYRPTSREAPVPQRRAESEPVRQ